MRMSSPGTSLLAFELLRPHADELDLQLYRTVSLACFYSGLGRGKVFPLRRRPAVVLFTRGLGLLSAGVHIKSFTSA